MKCSYCGKDLIEMPDGFFHPQPTCAPQGAPKPDCYFVLDGDGIAIHAKPHVTLDAAEGEAAEERERRHFALPPRILRCYLPKGSFPPPSSGQQPHAVGDPAATTHSDVLASLSTELKPWLDAGEEALRDLHTAPPPSSGERRDALTSEELEEIATVTPRDVRQMTDDQITDLLRLARLGASGERRGVGLAQRLQIAAIHLEGDARQWRKPSLDAHRLDDFALAESAASFCEEYDALEQASAVRRIADRLRSKDGGLPEFGMKDGIYFIPDEMCNRCGHRRDQHPIRVCGGFCVSGCYESTHVDGPDLQIDATTERRTNNGGG